MKTEQEQIEQMIKIFKNNREVCHYTSCIKCKYCDDEDCMCSSYAYSLYQAGYSDVSEYKAEIERLKEKNNELNKEKWSLEEELKKKELEITYARNNGYEKGYDECEEYTKGEIKQVKINILRELKENAVEIYSKEFGQMEFVGVDAIDELIKEVQNEN